MNKTEFIQRAAIQVFPQCVANCNEVLLRGGSLTEPTLAKQVAKMATQYAEALYQEINS